MQYRQAAHVTYLGAKRLLRNQILDHAPEKLKLIVKRQAPDGLLHDGAGRRLAESDEGRDVHVGKETHDELAVHAVRDAPMAGDRVAKGLDLEGPLEARREKATKGGDERRKRGPEKGVNLHRRHAEAHVPVVGEEEQAGRRVHLWDEDGIGLALETREVRGAEVVDRADKVGRLNQDMREEDTKQHRHDPRAHKTLDRLLRRQLDELRAAKCNSANVGKDVVGDDQRGRQEEPEHAFKHVVDDEVCLEDDEEEGNVRPGKLCKLKLELARLERSHEEDESCGASKLANGVQALVDADKHTYQKCTE